MKNPFHPLLILPFLFLACSDEGTPLVKTNQENNTETIVADTEQDTMTEASRVAVSDSVRFVFSGAFVPSDFKTTNWIGIYKDDKGMYCKSTQAKVKAVRDMWNEDEDNLDATIIEDVSKDASVFLFSGITVPENFRVTSFNNIPNRILVGNSTNIGDYTLKANGEVTKENQLPLTYRLTFMGSKNGKKVEQVIVDHQFLDDAMTAIMWVGDLDADGIPDMIIDMSPKYSYSTPTLFLSSIADEGNLLKLVAECESDFGGC